ncbi:hypothetical protein HK101_008557 [Irineochytrium annulatum]|nr:hypothetical protein HK101_008557 [Irineochytrium annulatum]
MEETIDELVSSAAGEGGLTAEALEGIGSKSQLVLHQCFRTVKESSAMMEVVLCRSPLPSNKKSVENSFIDYDQFVDGGTALKDLLLMVRHRGAFSAREFLIELPKLWLEHLLDNIASVSMSITRRSGGLPLGVLAILSSPSPSKLILLRHAMTRTFEIAKMDLTALDTVSSSELDLPQVHALNIIRQLLLDGELVNPMREYISDAYILSIKGFSSPR